jgi:hypothetical protein
MFRTAVLLTALAALASGSPAQARDKSAARGEQKLAQLLADRIPGKPVSCINLRDIRSSQIVDGTAIVYEGLGHRLYVNRPKSGADSLRSDDILVTKTWSGQLCSIDTVNLVDRASRFPHGFVGLGEFVPYARVKAEARQGASG